LLIRRFFQPISLSMIIALVKSTINSYLFLDSVVSPLNLM
jgi:hypothetical protein